MNPFILEDDEETVDVLDQPLFEELSEKHERQDAWGGPYGAMLGDWGEPTMYELSVQYLDAANLLYAAIKRQEVEDFTVARPILFLYRHSLEALIKSRLAVVPKSHSLNKLIGQYRTEVASKYKCRVPRWIMERINDIGAVDPGSTGFRYPNCLAVDGEHIYLSQLQTVVTALHSAINDAPTFRTNLPIFRGY